jgi:N-dimethylarginine dimethylaminohydrolase
MFGFMHGSGSRSLSKAMRRALEKDGLPSGISSASMLRVVQSAGRVSDRTVTFIRVFDPVRAAERAVDVRSFRDLDAQPGLILKAGHIESDGIVVITRHMPARDVDMSESVRTDQASPGDGMPPMFRGVGSATSGPAAPRSS